MNKTKPTYICQACGAVMNKPNKHARNVRGMLKCLQQQVIDIRDELIAVANEKQ